MSVNIAIFVSGNGTNLEQIIRHFKGSDIVNISLVVSNKADAYALVRAAKHGIHSVVLKKADINNPEVILPLLRHYNVDFIVLAGFLLMVPTFVIDEYPMRIINLHPALLPKFGGKGMYGHHVHEAVKAAGETVTGFTAHYVSPVCDGGDIIKQYSVDISPDDSPQEIAAKENQLELKYFPEVVEMVIKRTFFEKEQNSKDKI